MFYVTTIFGLVVLLATVGQAHEGRNVYERAIIARQSNSSAEDAYLQEVCYPNVTQPVIPPCQEITNIESACLPNGTSAIDLLAHAECMCGGSYFQDWIGCLDCDFVHGARSPAETSVYATILSSASNELCTGTPTAPFQSIFASLNYNPVVTGMETDMSDLYPSQTAVSLYFTASGPQGPGQVTGSATAATKVVSTGSGSTGSSGSGGSTKTSGIGTSGESATAGSGGSSTSSSKAGAAPTGVWVGAWGLVAGMAGLVVLGERV